MAYNLYIISNKLFEPLILEQSVSETWCEDTQQRRRVVVTISSMWAAKPSDDVICSNNEP